MPETRGAGSPWHVWVLVAAIAALGAALKDDNLEVKRHGAFALAAMQAAPPDVIPILVRTLNRKDLASMAGTALFQIGKPAIPSLIEALSSESAQVRKEAILALLRIGPQAPEAVQPITRALEDKDPGVQQAAKQALTALHARVPN